MFRRLLLTLLILIPPVLAQGQSSVVTSGASTPATCKANAAYKPMYYKNGTGLYICTADNTWTLVAGIGVVTTTGSPSAGDFAKFSGASTITTSLFAVSGPATSTKTFTFPNASATVLTDNAAVTVSQGGTGAAPGGDDQVLVSSSSSAASWKTVNDCAGANQALTYTQSSNTWGCVTITGGGGGGVGDVTGQASSVDSEVALFSGTGGKTIKRATGTGLALLTSGVQSAYAGSSCSAGAYVTAVSASGVATCTSGATAGAGWSEVIAASDQDVASSTTVANDAELFFTMAAGALYEFETYIIYNSPAGGGTPDFKYAFAGPATLTGQYSITLFVGTGDTLTGAFAQAALGTTSSIGTATTARMVFNHGWASSSAGGSGSSGFMFQWAQATSGVNATRRLAGSVLRYRRLL